MLCTRNIWASRWLLSTSTLASTQAPLPSIASFSRTGESCLHGPHHSAQKSMTTGTDRDRSSTSVWNVASVTSMIVTPPAAGGRGAASAASGGGAGVPDSVAGLAAAGLGAGERSAPRSTAPRVKIDELVRGSLMVT